MNKPKYVVFAVLMLAVLGSKAEASIVISIKNLRTVTVGIPIVDGSGVAVAKNTIYASAGTFPTEPDWSTATIQEIPASFQSVDSSPLSNSQFSGLFTGIDSTLSSYPTGFDRSTAYIVVGNSSTIASSTMIAVYKAIETTYPTHLYLVIRPLQSMPPLRPTGSLVL